MDIYTSEEFAEMVDEILGPIPHSFDLYESDVELFAHLDNIGQAPTFTVLS